MTVVYGMQIFLRGGRIIEANVTDWNVDGSPGSSLERLTLTVVGGQKIPHILLSEVIGVLTIPIPEGERNAFPADWLNDSTRYEFNAMRPPPSDTGWLE